MDFERRQELHDEDAHRLLERRLEALGVRVFLFGAEHVGRELAEALREQPDPLARLIRHRPDRIVVIPRVTTFYAEIKSEAAGQDNFGVEVASDEVLQEIHSPTSPVAYMLCDLQDGTVSCCWVEELPRTHIDIPPRDDVKATHIRLAAAYPDAKIRELKWRPATGSGTPYFLVSKQHPSLRSLGNFLEELM